MDFCRIRCDCIHCIHICRKFFNLNFNCICRCTCMFFCISCYDCNRITKLENLLIAEYRTFKSICLIVFRKHYKTINLVCSAGCFNVFCSDNTENPRHAFCFCCINAEDVRMRNFCLCKCQTKSSLRHL